MTEHSSRLELIDKVACTFRANGFHGTTMSMISERTGLGRSSIYHYFGQGKLEMAQRSLDTIDASICVMRDTVIASDITLWSKWKMIEDMLRKHYQGGQLGCLLAVFAMEDVPDELRERTKVLFERWLDAMADLHRFRGAGDARARRSAQRDIAAIQGALVLSRAQSSSEPFDQALGEVGTAFSELLGNGDTR